MQQRFGGTVALVTGAGRGIGLAVASRFAREGARVVLNDVDAASADQGAAAIRAEGGEALAVAADVSDKAAVTRLFDTALERYGDVNALVNNAGLTNVSRHFLEGDEAWWDQVLDTNLKSVFLCSHRAAWLMARRKGGSIVTSVATGLSEEQLRERGRVMPLGRLGDPDEVAGPVAFLCSEDARYMTGHVLVVDGGLLVQQRSPQVDIFPLERYPVVEKE